jgi:hypothetical protein
MARTDSIKQSQVPVLLMDLWTFLVCVCVCVCVWWDGEVVCMRVHV